MTPINHKCRDQTASTDALGHELNYDVIDLVACSHKRYLQLSHRAMRSFGNNNKFYRPK